MLPEHLKALQAKGYTRGPDGIFRRHDSNGGHPEGAQPKKQPAPKEPRTRSPLEVKFASLWQELRGPLLVPEHRFDKTRKWRFDLAHPVAHVAIELEGGIHSGGRHNRADGFKKDCEKYNSAAADGWILFRLCTGMVTRENVEPIMACIRRRLSE
jgi:very-short-patch-repair endonuclease